MAPIETFFSIYSSEKNGTARTLDIFGKKICSGKVAKIFIIIVFEYYPKCIERDAFLKIISGDRQKGLQHNNRKFELKYLIRGVGSEERV